MITSAAQASHGSLENAGHVRHPPVMVRFTNTSIIPEHTGGEPKVAPPSRVPRGWHFNPRSILLVGSAALWLCAGASKPAAAQVSNPGGAPMIDAPGRLPVFVPQPGALLPNVLGKRDVYAGEHERVVDENLSIQSSPNDPWFIRLGHEARRMLHRPIEKFDKQTIEKYTADWDAEGKLRYTDGSLVHTFDRHGWLNQKQPPVHYYIVRSDAKMVVFPLKLSFPMGNAYRKHSSPVDSENGEGVGLGGLIIVRMGDWEYLDRDTGHFHPTEQHLADYVELAFEKGASRSVHVESNTFVSTKNKQEWFMQWMSDYRLRMAATFVGTWVVGTATLAAALVYYLPSNPPEVASRPDPADGPTPVMAY